IWRASLMMRRPCDCLRAFTKPGIAKAASNPMIATTIIISTRVNAALFRCSFRIMVLSLLCFGDADCTVQSHLYVDGSLKSKSRPDGRETRENQHKSVGGPRALREFP